MLITYHDEKKIPFQISDVASTLFFGGILLSFGETCFQKNILSNIPCLQKTKGRG
jgi:hypothetical protein